MEAKPEKISDFENVVVIGMSENFIIYKATVKDDETLYLVTDRNKKIHSCEDKLDKCTRYIHKTDNCIRWVNR